MALDRLTKIDGGGISTTSDYRVGVITATKFAGPFDGTAGNFSGIITASGANFSGNVTIGGTLTYEDVTNIDSVGIITAQQGIHVGAGVSAVGVGTFGSLDIGGDIDVDGHTNLDNVSVAGVTTFTGAIDANSTLEVAGIANFDSTVQVADKIEHLGDTDTAIRFPAADTIRFEVGNQQAVHVLPSSAGSGGARMGLGTNNPTGMLHIYGVNPPVRIQNSNDSANLQFGMWDTANIMFQASNRTFKFATETSNDITFFTGGLVGSNQRLRITSGGTVNIGGNYSHTGSKLQVTGNSTFTGNIDANGDIDVDGHTELDNVNISGVTTITSTAPELHLTDTNADSDYSLVVNGGSFRLRDETNGENRVVLYSTGVLHADTPTVVLGESTFGSSSITKTYGGAGGIRKNALMVLNPSASVTGRGAGVAVGALGTGDDYIGTLYASRSSTGDNRGTTTLEGKDDIVIKTNSSGTTKTALTFGTDGELAIPSGSNSASRLTFGGSINIYHDGNMKFENATGYLKLQSNNNLYIDGAELFFRNAGGTNRWKIDSSGHILPGAVGSYNIGSTGAEIGNVYIADDKKVFFGTDQDFSIKHSGTNAFIDNDTGNLNIQSDTVYISNKSGGSIFAEFTNGGASKLRYAGGVKLATSGIGITVTGEVAATQDYPNFRPTLDLNFAAVKKLDPIITYQRTGSASFVNESGKVVLVGDNAPRFDHDPITRECKGLLIEESRTNIHPYSQDLSNWVVESGGSVTANTHISPAGDQTADSLNGTQSGSSAYRTFSLTSGTPYTFTVFLKYVSGNTNIQIQIGDSPFTRSYTTFNTSTGALVSSSGGTQTVNDVVAFPNGWYRVSITRTPTSTASGFMDINHTSSTASTVAVWGAQVEAGSFATSYILTEGTANVTRGRDIVDIDGEDFTDFYNQTESTIISSHTLLQDVPNAENVYVYQIQDATTNNAIRVVDKNSSYSNVATGLVISGGSSVFHFNTTTDSFTKDKVLVALSVKQDDFAGCHNGGAISTDNSGTLPTNFNALGIGRYPPSGGYELNGHIQRFIYYPKQLSDSQLKTLTA